MSIGREEIQRLAYFARLALTPAEETELGEHLSQREICQTAHNCEVHRLCPLLFPHRDGDGLPRARLTERGHDPSSCRPDNANGQPLRRAAESSWLPILI